MLRRHTEKPQVLGGSTEPWTGLRGALPERIVLGRGALTLDAREGLPNPQRSDVAATEREEDDGGEDVELGPEDESDGEDVGADIAGDDAELASVLKGGAEQKSESLLGYYTSFPHRMQLGSALLAQPVNTVQAFGIQDNGDLGTNLEEVKANAAAAAAASASPAVGETEVLGTRRARTNVSYAEYADLDMPEDSEESADSDMYEQEDSSDSEFDLAKEEGYARGRSGASRPRFTHRQRNLGAGIAPASRGSQQASVQQLQQRHRTSGAGGKAADAAAAQRSPWAVPQGKDYARDGRSYFGVAPPRRLVQLQAFDMRARQAAAGEAASDYVKQDYYRTQQRQQQEAVAAGLALPGSSRRMNMAIPPAVQSRMHSFADIAHGSLRLLNPVAPGSFDEMYLGEDLAGSADRDAADLDESTPKVTLANAVVPGVSAPPVLVPVTIAIEDAGGCKIRDAFTWNLAEPFISPDQFAAQFVADLGLSKDYIANVAKQIVDQCNEHASIAQFPVRTDLEARKAVEKDIRVIVNIDVTCENIRLVDRFEWDLSSDLSPELFAAVLCRDLALAPSARPVIAHAIHDELLRHKKTAIEMGVLVPASDADADDGGGAAAALALAPDAPAPTPDSIESAFDALSGPSHTLNVPTGFEKSLPEGSAPPATPRARITPHPTDQGAGDRSAAIREAAAASMSVQPGALPLEGIWRDWVEAAFFGPRVELLSADDIDRIDQDRDRLVKRIRKTGDRAPTRRRRAI